jgi:hypothetical protein
MFSSSFWITKTILSIQASGVPHSTVYIGEIKQLLINTYDKNGFFLAVLQIGIWIRIHRIHMFSGLPDPDPDPLVRGMDPDPDPALDPDPDPSIIMQK